MKTLLILWALVSAANGQGRTLSAADSAGLLRDFQELCDRGQLRDGGSLVNINGEQTWLTCNQAPGQEVVEDSTRVPFSVPEPPSQTVFVRPRDVLLNQRVSVEGRIPVPKTRIFHAPPAITPNVQVQVNAVTEAPQRPSVIFLRGQDGRAPLINGLSPDSILAPRQEEPRLDNVPAIIGDNRDRDQVRNPLVVSLRPRDDPLDSRLNDDLRRPRPSSDRDTDRQARRRLEEDRLTRLLEDELRRRRPSSADRDADRDRQARRRSDENRLNRLLDDELRRQRQSTDRQARRRLEQDRLNRLLDEELRRQRPTTDDRNRRADSRGDDDLLPPARSGDDGRAIITRDELESALREGGAAASNVKPRFFLIKQN